VHLAVGFWLARIGYLGGIAKKSAITQIAIVKALAVGIFMARANAGAVVTLAVATELANRTGVAVVTCCNDR
jgi:hypothetical protein